MSQNVTLPVTAFFEFLSVIFELMSCERRFKADNSVNQESSPTSGINDILKKAKQQISIKLKV